MHAIDIHNNSITRIIPQSPEPCPRIGHVFSIDKDSRTAILWGGCQTQGLNDLWTFDFEKLIWTNLVSDVQGRSYSAFTASGPSLYVVGSCKNDVILKYEPEKDEMTMLNPLGNPPPLDMKGAMITRVDRFLFFIGGILESAKYSMVRAYDTVLNWWFVFLIEPDGVTTTLADGNVDKLGIFSVPRLSESSMVYREKQRELGLFLGSPSLDPPPISTIAIGSALAVLHLQLDMREILSGFTLRE
jgi:hypothetical protein